MNKNRRKEFIPNFRRAFIQAIINRFLQHLVAKDDYHRLQYFKSKRIKGTQKDYHSSYTLHSSFLPLLRQISRGISRFVAKRGECRNKLRRKERKNYEVVKKPRNFAVSKGTNRHPEDKKKRTIKSLS